MNLKEKTVFISGIGGHGMFGIAILLNQIGAKVIGSDIHKNERTRHLENIGIHLIFEQSKESADSIINRYKPDYFVYTSALKQDSPELLTFRTNGIKCLKRKAFLPILLKKRKLITVSGTSGKGTTCAMIIDILRNSSIQCGYLIGLDSKKYGQADWGNNEYFVIEADEYDYMFHGLDPNIAVFTNINWDHPDIYPTEAAYIQAFTDFIKDQNIPVIYNSDNDGCIKATGELKNRKFTFGLNGDISINLKKSTINYKGINYDINMQLLGDYNKYNAAAAILVALFLKIDIKHAIHIIENTCGLKERFEYLHNSEKLKIVFDYVFNQHEIEAVKQNILTNFKDHKITIIYGPSMYTRYSSYKKKIAEALSNENFDIFIVEIFTPRDKIPEHIDIDKDIYEFTNTLNAQFKKYIPNNPNQIIDELNNRQSDQKQLILLYGASKSIIDLQSLLPLEYAKTKSRL